MLPSSFHFTVGTIALLFELTTAALFFVITASISVVNNPTQFVLLLVSAVTETLSCICLAFLIFWPTDWTQRGRRLSTSLSRVGGNLSLLLLGLLPWLVAAAVGAVALGTLAIHQGSNFFGRQITTVALVIYIVSFFVQAFFLLVLIFCRDVKAQTKQELVNDMCDGHSMRQTNEAGSAAAHLSNPFKDKLPPVPIVTPLDSSSSLRSSFSTSRRPSSSKRNFSIRSASQPHPSERSSSDEPSTRPSQDEGFDAWDTSDLSTQMKETVLQTGKAQVKGTALPTIPGSRSPSPAKALEGPFFDPSPEHTPPRSPLPQPPVSQTTSPISPQSPTFPKHFPPPLMTSTSTTPASSPPMQSRRFSRPPSLPRQSAEEHIHPLFRCSSPTPPPSASPTTVVTAAPEAGEVIDRRTLHRMRSVSQRSSSQPPSSSPMQRSVSFTNADGASKWNTATPISSPKPPPEGFPKSMHQRKRSASFEGCILRKETPSNDLNE